MKNALMVLFCAGVALATSAAWAQQGVPPAAAPAPATAAPALTPAAKSLLSLWHPYGDAQNSQNNLANPNHTLDEILTWSQQTTADALSFSPDDRVSKMEGFKKYFVKQGWDLYLAYLHDSNIQDMIDREGYFVSTIVPNIPQIYSSGTKDGAYHWIVKMPITIGFYKKSASANVDPQPGPSGKFILYIDVMRVASGGDDGVAIVNWQVTATPK
jgi:hypothetical protein